MAEQLEQQVAEESGSEETAMSDEALLAELDQIDATLRDVNARRGELFAELIKRGLSRPD